MKTEDIKEFSGRIIARVTTDDKGNKTVSNFYGTVLGRYDKQNNVTREFSGRVIAHGDATGMLIGKK